MPFRGGGRYYGGGGERFATVDPLAEAIREALGAGMGAFQMVRGVRMENADRTAAAEERRRMIERQQQLDQRDEERYQAGVSRDTQARQDALDKETRDRNARRAERLEARGISVVPTGFGGTTYAKVAPTEDELERAVEDRIMTDRLRQQAKALQVPGADTLSRGELEVLVAEAKAAREVDREFSDFKRRENYQEGLVRGRPEAAPKPTAAIATESERKAAALLNQATEAYNALQTYQPSVRAQQLSRVPVIGNILSGRADPEGQAAQQAGIQFADAYMRYVSGAAVPEEEVRRYAATFLPQPGDSPETVARKKSAQKTLMESLRIGAGRLAPPSAGDTSASGDDADAWAAAYLARRRGGSR